MILNFFFSTLNWNPNPTAFTLPYFDLEVRWYGLFFVVGFYIGYLMVEKKVRNLVSSSFYLRDIKSTDFFNEELKALLEKNNEEAKLFKMAFSHNQTFDKLNLFNKLNALLIENPSKINKTFLLNAFPKTLFSSKELSNYFSDHLLWYLVIGTVIGARLGHVFFYEWPYYQNNLLAIFNIREGGLASHGGTIGVLLALFLFSQTTLKRFPELSLFKLMDILTVPIALVVSFIRLGNFFNQEILGKPTDLPWSILFLNPASGESIVPRHPVQLYESLAYFLSFLFLFFLPENKLKVGQRSGIFLILIFGSRFFLEFLKEPPPALVFSEKTLLTGQLLSIPFVALGVYFYIRNRRSPVSFKKQGNSHAS